VKAAMCTGTSMSQKKGSCVFVPTQGGSYLNQVFKERNYRYRTGEPRNLCRRERGAGEADIVKVGEKGSTLLLSLGSGLPDCLADSNNTISVIPPVSRGSRLLTKPV